ncbi:MAG: DnaA/Hda family protein [Bdellovibrionota bacterium]
MSHLGSAFCRVPVIPEKPNLPVFNDALIELDFNTVAVQCSRMFSIGKGMPINPLVVYAGVGMGKTHLLSQIGWEFHRANPQKTVRYVTAESFTNEMVQSYKSNQIMLSKKHTEHTDVLSISRGSPAPAFAGRASCTCLTKSSFGR